MRNKLFLLSILVLLFLSAVAFFDRLGNKVVGNKNVVTEQRLVEKFNQIELCGSLDVEIINGDVPNVEIVGESNLIPYIGIQVQDGRLMIATKQHVRLQPTLPLLIKVYTPSLMAVSSVGSGSITAKDELPIRDLDVRLSGSGRVQLKLSAANKINATLTGSGNMELNGWTAKEMNLRLTGSGSIKSLTIGSTNSRVQLTGSGQVSVKALTTLDVVLNGSGNVGYVGTPKLSISSKGSGSIQSIE